MTDNELMEIEARAAKATEGPWVRAKWPGDFDIVRQSEWTPCGEADHDDCSVAQMIHHKEVALLNQGHDSERVKNDAEFIAHARADVPALIAEVRRLRVSVSRAYEEAAQKAAAVADRARSKSQANLTENGYGYEYLGGIENGADEIESAIRSLATRPAESDEKSQSCAGRGDTNDAQSIFA